MPHKEHFWPEEMKRRVVTEYAKLAQGQEKQN